MRLYVGIATVGRAALARETVERLGTQTRPPDGVIVVGADETDVAPIRRVRGPIEVLLSDRGLCIQRNRALAHLGDRADVLVFFDDDFVPAPDYLERLEQLFEREPDVVGATGRIVADGIKGRGYDVEEALEMLAADTPPAEPQDHIAEALYGCNMAIRLSAMEGLRFDEALPLYGWLEDIDVTFQLGRRGRLIRSDHFAGVHMGAKAGRTSGVKFGYSQIANPLYMLEKRSAPTHLAVQMILRNLAANLVGSLWPEPHVDRRGRLRGNCIALGHLVTRRLDPRHILVLR
jgi:glycosyltransferase involved in cell wall biosynthesis